MPSDDPDAVQSAVRKALSVFAHPHEPAILPQLSRGDITSRALSAGSSSSSPVETDEVLLIPSCFPQRRATILMQPADSRCGSARTASSTCFVRPLSPRTGGAAAGASSPSPCADESDSGAGVVVKRVARRGAAASGGPYENMHYVLGDNVTAFTALLATMAHNGFTVLSARLGATDRTSSSWSLQWIKQPARSVFVKAPLVHYQKINHIPGTQSLGHKAQLHMLLTAAEKRWCDIAAGMDSLPQALTPNVHPHPPHRLFPRAWVVPAEREACLQALRAPENAGQLFIAKPCGGAGGQGIYLLRGAANVSLGPCEDASMSTGVQKVERPWVVQRYVPRPYLVAGHKFDLRLYVVVTSYWPLRLYLYQEGLVRVASSPYYKAGTSSSSSETANKTALTAHLTNFTVNKSAPAAAAATECGATAGSTEEKQEAQHVEAWPGTKWSLAALAAYMKAMGDADYDATMDRVRDLLGRVFAAAAPEVRDALTSIEAERHRVVGASESSVDACGPPCTFKGISPFFEIYGVDVLLEQPSASEMESVDATQSVALHPVLMEVNIMPSLSTHYSVLDQSIKGCFVADTLTLVGLTSPRFKPANKATPPVSSWPPPEGSESTAQAHHQRTFLSSLGEMAAVEACMTAEEEHRRALCARFTRVVPTPHSFEAYWPLLCGQCQDGRHDKVLRFDRLLSEWEQWKAKAPGGS